ncbi:hypothetical protein BMF94_2565 [Rhodotorula taiwanensis]|uniref:RTA1-domain-containing protein n=1 Tax=Rhodotorula taiwanensis TaxID=741276 RepID=A0A2S5BCA5_9BASI|nr:hypothetical protein BMF94_2565 [Rhodotorula taiwanensis]
MLELAERDQDSKEILRNILGYHPSVGAAVLAIALYAASTAVLWINFFRTFRGNKFMIVLLAGMTAMMAGFVFRVLYSNDSTQVGFYLPMILCILLSPTTFLAINYMLLGRLARALDATKALLLPAGLIAKLFVLSDIATFVLQAFGSGSSASGDVGSSDKIIKIGLVVQLVSYLVFCLIFLVFGLRVPHVQRGLENTPFRWRYLNPFSVRPIDNWKVLFWAITFSSIGIIASWVARFQTDPHSHLTTPIALAQIRSVDRVLEYTQGDALRTHEAYFYLLDTLPLWLATTVYVFVWPPRVLAGARGLVQLDGQDGSYREFGSADSILRMDAVGLERTSPY